MAITRSPLLTLVVHEQFQSARAHAGQSLTCSLDLGRSTSTAEIHAAHWLWRGQSYPYLDSCKPRTIYYWAGENFQPVSRYANSLIKLVSTEWDAPNKVALIQPRGKVILDCCGGLGYFAAHCLQGGATRIVSFEKNSDVIWLRALNPWSPEWDVADARLELRNEDVSERIAGLADESFDPILHDPPRFGIAGELYSQLFYDQLARVLKRNGRLFHYTGSPNKLTSGRDVPNEVSKRLRLAGFTTEIKGDGVLAVKRSRKQVMML
jgi:uncharacterized protein